MNQARELIKRLEEENKALKTQLSKYNMDKLQVEYLDKILKYSKEVIAVITYDGKGTIEQISDSISAYGYSPDEFTSGKLSYWDIVHPDDLKKLQENVDKKTTAIGKGFELDYRIYSKTGRIVWVMGTSIPVKGPSGEIVRHVLKVNNINKYKRYEEELLDINENLFVTLKSIGEAVILIDPNGYIERLNAAAEKMVGIINLKAKNKPLYEVIQFSFSSDFSILVDPLKMDTEMYKMVQVDEIFMRCHFNIQYRVSCTVSPIMIQKGKLERYVMVVKDLTSVYDTLQASQENERILKTKLELLLSEDVDVKDIELTDIIPVEQLQVLQEKFSIANGVSSVITDLNDVAITQPSNFNDTCTSLLYSGERCYQVNRLLCHNESEKHPCKLMDAKAPIYIGGKHIADWKIGMCGFGGIIAPFMKAACNSNEKYVEMYAALQDDTKKHFQNICVLLEIMANKISDIGYNNVKLAHELIKGKENEAKLAESETTFRSIFDNSIDGIFLTDLNGIVKEWSSGYEQLSGISKKQAIGNHIWDVVEMMLPQGKYNNAELSQMKADLNTIIHHQEQKIITRQIVNQKTKKDRITHTLYFPVCLPGSTMMGAISRDATEDILSEQKLMKNNALLEGMMNTIPTPIFVKNVNGNYVRSNDAFLSMFNLKKDDVFDKNAAQVFPQDLLKKIEQQEDNLVSSDKMLQTETKIDTILGQRDVIIYRNVFYDEAGEKQGIVGAIFDVTDMKNAERELTAEKERLQALGDNYPNGCLYRADMNMQTQKLHIIYISRNWKDLFGEISEEDTVNDLNLIFDRIHPDDLSKHIEAIKESAKTMSNLDVEMRFCLDDGSVKWLHVSAHPHLEGKHMVVWDGFILDITERKNTELKLEAYRTDLEGIVKERTEELEATNEELYATNEELYATNEEYAVINEELHQKNDQLQNEISARKEAVKQLEDSESKMRNFISQSYEGIVILDEEGKIIEWNTAQERITGISGKKAIGKYAWEPYGELLNGTPAEKNVAQFRQQVLSFLQKGIHQEPNESEYIFHTTENNERHINMVSFPIGLVDKCYFGEIVRDVTEQKMAEIELEHYRTQLEEMVAAQTKELISSKERLTSLSDNLPGGVIFQMYAKGEQDTQFTYISAHFVDMFYISVEDVMEDNSLFFNAIHPDDRSLFIEHYTTARERGYIDIETRIQCRNGETKWIHIRATDSLLDDGTRVWDGFMIDVTNRKKAERELEDSNKRQSILIKVLQVMQASESIPDAINISLTEIGKYADVSRVYIFEKSADGKSASNTYEWCNDGIVPEIDNLQDVPIEYMEDWFETFETGQYICASDIRTLSPIAYEKLSAQGIKSILVLPLVANGINYGFVGFDECVRYKEWRSQEVELLISLSQIISNTTRRYWAEKSIQLSQQTMRTVLDNIDANIYVADFDTWEVLFANKKIKEELGAEVEGKKCWQVIQKDKSAPCDFCPNPKLLDKNKRPTGLYHWEVQNEHTHKWYECTDAAIEWVDGRLVHMEYATDITDRRQAEEALRQSEELYRQLTVASPDAIVVCDPQGQVVFISPRAKELFLIGDDSDVTSVHLTHFVHPRDVEQAMEMFRKILIDNISFQPQILLKRNDGTEFFGEISSASVKDAEGNTTSVIMVIRDITERKMSEMELIRAKEKAEESDKLKSAFLANMSHEIRTPINGIIGFLNFLADDNLTPKRRQEYINVINNSSIQLVKLIDDIIDVAKIEAKQMSIRPVPFHLNDFMEELYIFFETYLQANNKDKIALILDDSQFIDACVTYVDPMRLRQVLSNLIGNAVKFTEKGFIRFGYRQVSSGMLEFFVEDSGIGIAKDQLEVIFERFRQAELSNNRRYGGTGLGLTISRSLVQMMGGDMSVKSMEEEGSSFYFTIAYLPVSAEDEHIFENSEDEDDLQNGLLKNMTILVVEPEIMKCKYYEKLLHSTGATLIFAHTVAHWIDVISQQSHIDVVLADTSIFDKEENMTIKQIRLIRAGLPLVLIVPEQNELYSETQYGEVIEGPVNYAKLYEILQKYT